MDVERPEMRERIAEEVHLLFTKYVPAYTYSQRDMDMCIDKLVALIPAPVEEAMEAELAWRSMEAEFDYNKPNTDYTPSPPVEVPQDRVEAVKKILRTARLWEYLWDYNLERLTKLICQLFNQDKIDSSARRVEAVKKITHPFCFDKNIGFAKNGCPHPNNHFCQGCEDEAKQICQLFIKDLPLLSPDEITSHFDEAVRDGIFHNLDFGIAISKAQRDKDAGILVKAQELPLLSDEEMEQHRFFGLHSTPIPMLHVEAIAKAQRDKDAGIKE